MDSASDGAPTRSSRSSASRRFIFGVLLLAGAGAIPTKTEWLRGSAQESPLPEVVEFHAGEGTTIRIRLRPDFSSESRDFVGAAALSGCRGEWYRNEPWGVLQGRLACGPDMPPVVKGPCPSGAVLDPNRECFAHDPDCGCHGPVMRRGMVAWAGGGSGPDFFLYTGAEPARHWQNDHTVFGEIADDESWEAIARLHALPATDRRGMTMLDAKHPLVVQVPDARELRR